MKTEEQVKKEVERYKEKILDQMEDIKSIAGTYVRKAKAGKTLHYGEWSEIGEITKAFKTLEYYVTNLHVAERILEVEYEED